MKSFIIGVVVGSLAGAIAGLLLAPDSGYDSRRRVSGAAYSAKDRVSQLASGVHYKASEVVGAIKQSI
jgi:gas vesicle protein